MGTLINHYKASEAQLKNKNLSKAREHFAIIAEKFGTTSAIVSFSFFNSEGFDDFVEEIVKKANE